MLNLRFTLEVCRASDHVQVARTMPKPIPQTTIGIYDAKEDARRLSDIYGHRFYVEVWVFNPNDEHDYYRAYTFQARRCVQAVGF